MDELVLVVIGFVIFMIPFACAASVGLSKFTKIGLAGMCIAGIACYVADYLFKTNPIMSPLVQRITCLFPALLIIVIATALLVFIGTTKTTWEKRRDIFTITKKKRANNGIPLGEKRQDNVKQ